MQSRIIKQPPPREVLNRLLENVPAFARSWSESLFKEDDGSFTAHGVFATFSWYFRDHFGELTEDARRGVFNFVEECVSFEKEISEGVSNAAGTCFLENIAGDKELADVSKYLGPESREFFERWN